MTSVKDRKKALEARLDELLGRLKRIEAELDQPAEKDWEEAAVEREDDELLESMGEAEIPSSVIGEMVAGSRPANTAIA